MGQSRVENEFIFIGRFSSMKLLNLQVLKKDEY